MREGWSSDQCRGGAGSSASVARAVDLPQGLRSLGTYPARVSREGDSRATRQPARSRSARSSPARGSAQGTPVSAGSGRSELGLRVSTGSPLLAVGRPDLEQERPGLQSRLPKEGQTRRGGMRSPELAPRSSRYFGASSAPRWLGPASARDPVRKLQEPRSRSRSRWGAARTRIPGRGRPGFLFTQVWGSFCS